jgi:hypothetical protein
MRPVLVPGAGKVYELHRTTVAKHVARAGKAGPVMTEEQIDEAVDRRLFLVGGAGWDSGDDRCGCVTVRWASPGSA